MEEHENSACGEVLVVVTLHSGCGEPESKM